MQREEVVITVEADGSTKVEANGVVGQGCKALTEAFERALGSSVSEQRKPEWFRTAKQGQQAKQKG